MEAQPLLRLYATRTRYLVIRYTRTAVIGGFGIGT